MPVSLGPSLEPIPGYRLIERLGRGGFGEVWKAEAPGGLHKAIKFVYGDLDATENGEPADQEYKALKRIISIRHPYILSLERIDVVDGQLLIVMELADRNLWDRFRDCRAKGLPGVPREELLGYMKEAAEALDLMNFEYQLQHLDIKPQNLFLVYNHIKVADFGLVKAFEGKRGTITGGVTPVYAAPETFEGWVSRHSDQYSLGIVFQELLTGQRPFNGTTARQLLMQHLQAVPDVSSLPEADREIVARSLAKKPDNRFASSSDFIRALQGATNTPAKIVAEIPAAPPASDPAVRTPGTVATPATTPAKFVSDPLSTIPPPSSSARVPLTHARLQAPITEAHARLEVLALPELPAGRESLEQAGVLVPTFVIGLGGVANNILAMFRAYVRKQFGNESLPHLRVLAVDTDPDAIRGLTKKRSDGLRADEVFHAGLNRPSYYLKGDGPVGVDTWLGTSTLYQLPKNPAAAELRAFGRLALMDHAATLARRVRAEIDACRQPSSLAASNERTKLGIRSQRPRVFVVAGLGGGTGGGMFLDVGYLAKAVLRQLGDVQPEVIGVGLLPPTPAKGAKVNKATAQTHATLIELLHYCSEHTSYDTRFGDANRSVGDSDPPFARLAMFPLAEPESKSAADQAMAFVSHWLGNETLSHIGRVGELLRKEHPQPQQRLTTQTGAEFVFEYPRDELGDRAGRRLGLVVLQSWLTKLQTPDAGARVADAVDAAWEAQQLSADGMVQRVHDTICRMLGAVPADLIEQDFCALLASSAKGETLSASDVLLVVQKMTRMLGSPGGFHSEQNGPSEVATLLEQEAGNIIQEVEQSVADVVVQMMELPGVRISGAEEAIRLIESRVQGSLQTYESLLESLKAEASEIGRSVLPTISSLDRFSLKLKKRDHQIQGMIGSLRELSKKLYQGHVAQTMKQLYRGIFSSIPEYLREVQYCRERLNQAEKILADKVKQDETIAENAGLNLLPFNATNINECAERVIHEQTVADLIEYDQEVQKEVVQQFESLLGFCLSSGPRPEQLADVLETVGRTFIGQRLPENDSVSTLLRRGADVEELESLFNDAVVAAHPKLAGPEVAIENLVTIIGVPDNPSGQELRTRIEFAKFRTPLHISSHRRDVVIYRELQDLRITDLPHWGAIGKENYQLAINDAQMLPHSRIDVQWQIARV